LAKPPRGRGVVAVDVVRDCGELVGVSYFYGERFGV
jgi:hypothetical protein